MSSLTDRAAYLRGLADGMGLDNSKNEHRLILEMLELIDEMAQKITDVDNDVSELGDFVEDLDSDLSELEGVVYEGDDCCCDDDDDEDDDLCDIDEDDDLCFECPNCGKTVTIRASDIDEEESPVCQYCGEPFFTDITDEDQDFDKD